MKTWLLGALVLLTSLISSAPAQSGRIGKNCDLATQGVNETKTFLAFDQELRAALSKPDSGLIALLTSFPLRVIDERGSYYLNDAASLQARFQEVFSAEVRSAVLDNRPDTVFCNDSGIAYGNGAVWVTRIEHRFAVLAVNLRQPDSFVKPVGHVVKFACQTDTNRLIIDQENGKWRYRSWEKPHSLLRQPDTELTNGKQELQGTSPCEQAVWTFTEDRTELIIRALGGCNDVQSRSGSVGMVHVSKNGKQAVPSWCF